MENNVKLSSPWVIYYRQIQAFFKYDQKVHVSYDADSNIIKLYVDDPMKADALAELLPTEKKFGNVTVQLQVIPPNVVEFDKAEIFKIAFDGNPAVSYVQSAESPFGTFNYVVCANAVVQYYSDNLQDIHGYTSTLYQDIAKEIFKEDSEAFFCTDTPDGFGKPLGEWP